MPLSPSSSVRAGMPLGLTGAQAATRYVGATASGAPASGTFAVGDFVIDQTGKVYVCTAAGTPGTWAEIGAGGDLFAAYAQLEDQKASGTEGGGFTSGAWQTRTLNTEVDPDGIVSLAANQFTLQAGTYLLSGFALGVQCGQHKAKVANITDTADAVIGSSENVTTTAVIASPSTFSGVVTIAGAKVFELQHRCSNTRATYGLGGSSAFGVVEVYARVSILMFAA